MDEPFGAPTPSPAGHAVELIRILRRGRVTSVFVTHDLDEAILLADTVIVMTARPGRVKEVVDVPFSREERGEPLIETPEFAGLRHRLWKLLSEEQVGKTGTATAN
jgi:NitT/TauT family transport system ATP-binding protein